MFSAFRYDDDQTRYELRKPGPSFITGLFLADGFAHPCCKGRVVNNVINAIENACHYSSGC